MLKRKEEGSPIKDGVKRRTFTGCDTCRKRKIKCDGLKPQCLRCLKSNIICGGYGIKLKFSRPLVINKTGDMVVSNDVDEEINSKYQRRLIPFMNFIKDNEIYGTFQEMDPDLNALENISTLDTELVRGPFRVIKFNLRKFSPVRLPSISKIMKKSIVKAGSISPLPLSQPSKDVIFESDKKYSVTHQLHMAFSMAELRSSAENQKKPDVVVPRSIWIHPRLKIDAMLTYQTLIGSCDVITDDWKLVERTVFSELYNTESTLKNRIIDKMNLSEDIIKSEISLRSNDVIKALSVSTPNDSSWYTFTGLLRLHRVQELVRLFVKSQPNIMYFSFHGCLFDRVVIPFLYKTVGELLVFESSMGLNKSDDLEFNAYCDILKRIFCMIALSITSFSQYKILFNAYAIYDASLCYFKSFIAFREMALVYLAKLLKPFVQDGRSKEIMGKLFKAGHLKEFTITIIMAIYQDSYVDIIHNYKLLFGILQDISNYYKECNTSDEQMDDILLWYRYMNVFFKTCSTIDLDNYKIDDVGFEDLKANYNVINNPVFEAKPISFTSIEIKTISNTESSDVGKNENDVNDQPSKSFSIRFNHQEQTEVQNKVNDSTDNGMMDMTNGKKTLFNNQHQKSTKIFMPSDPEFGQNGISTVELSYGIPISLLELLERTLLLADHRNWCLRNNIHPRNFPKFCCDIEEDLMNWKLPWDLYEEVPDNDNGSLKFHSLFHKAIYHLTMSVYNTTLLFFFRLIKDIDPTLFQDRIISTIEQLEELKRLSVNGSFLRDMKISPPFWCFFIVGSDAIDITLQKRFDELGRTWFVAGHKWIGKQVMMEIWRGRNEEINNYDDDDEKENSWLDMIKGWEISGYN